MEPPVTWITWLALAFGVLVVALFGLAAFGASRWTAATGALLRKLEMARVPATPARYDVRELEGLPAPVQRYFRAVLKDGQPIITAVTVQHTGTFNVSASSERWMRFTSQQRVLTRRPGFVWNARITIVPGIAVVVHDAYVAGVGTLHPAVLGLFALTNQHGTGDIARGELMRYFAEAAWYPTALLPSQGVRWDAVDDCSSNATLTDGALSVTMLFSFSAAGLIESVRAEARGAVVGNKVVMMPWECGVSNYQQREGVRVPMSGEAARLPPAARQPYWRGTIMSMKYEFAA